MKRHLPMIAVGLVMLGFVGCTGCALFQDEGQADWSTEPAQEEAQP